MASSSYSFLDVAVLDQVRERFAAGEPIAILSADLEQVIWANGPGASLFGYRDIEAIIGSSPQLASSTRRQIAATPGFPAIGSDRAIFLRMTSGLSSRAVPFLASEITMPDGEAAVLLAARSDGTATAEGAISGFSTPGNAIALLNADAGFEAASPGFSRLGISDDTLAGLISRLRDSDGRVAKRMLPSGRGPMPAGAAKLTDVRYLLVVVDEAGESAPLAGEPLVVEPSSPVLPETLGDAALLIDDPAAAGRADAAEAAGTGPRVVEAPDAGEPMGLEPPVTTDAGPGEQVASAEAELSEQGTAAGAAEVDAQTVVDAGGGQPAVVEPDAFHAGRLDASQTDCEPDGQETGETMQAGGLPDATEDGSHPRGEEEAVERHRDRQPEGDDEAVSRAEPLAETGLHPKAEIGHGPRRELAAETAAEPEESATDPTGADVGQPTSPERTAIDPPGLPSPSSSAEGQAGAEASEQVPPQAQVASNPRSDAAPAFQRALTPVRFVWRTDAQGCFSQVSPEFAHAVGREAADVVGRSFGEVAAAFGLDPTGEIAGLLARRDTWSGRSVLWPIAGSALRLPVDLAALPVYGRGRTFEGFRGFGVARCGEAIPDPEARGLRPGEQLGRARTESEGGANPHREPANDELQPADPFRGEVPALAVVQMPDRRLSDKVVRLAEHREPENDKGLSSGERIAFEQIGERLKKDTDAAEALPAREAAVADAPPVPVSSDRPTQAQGSSTDGSEAALSDSSSSGAEVPQAAGESVPTVAPDPDVAGASFEESAADLPAEQVGEPGAAVDALRIDADEGESAARAESGDRQDDTSAGAGVPPVQAPAEDEGAGAIAPPVGAVISEAETDGASPARGEEPLGTAALRLDGAVAADPQPAASAAELAGTAEGEPGETSPGHLETPLPFAAQVAPELNPTALNDEPPVRDGPMPEPPQDARFEPLSEGVFAAAASQPPESATAVESAGADGGDGQGQTEGAIAPPAVSPSPAGDARTPARPLIRKARPGISLLDFAHWGAAADEQDVADPVQADATPPETASPTDHNHAAPAPADADGEVVPVAKSAAIGRPIELVERAGEWSNDQPLPSRPSGGGDEPLHAANAPLVAGGGTDAADQLEPPIGAEEVERAGLPDETAEMPPAATTEPPPAPTVGAGAIAAPEEPEPAHQESAVEPAAAAEAGPAPAVSGEPAPLKATADPAASMFADAGMAGGGGTDAADQFERPIGAEGIEQGGLTDETAEMPPAATTEPLPAATLEACAIAAPEEIEPAHQGSAVEPAAAAEAEPAPALSGEPAPAEATADPAASVSADPGEVPVAADDNLSEPADPVEPAPEDAKAEIELVPDDAPEAASAVEGEAAKDEPEGASVAAERAGWHADQSAAATGEAGPAGDLPRVEREAPEKRGSQPEPPSGAADASILDRLPVAVLVHSADRLHYANPEFFKLTGYSSVGELSGAGGIGALFVDPFEDEDESERSDRQLRLKQRGGQEFPVDAFLQSVPWKGGKALLLVLSRAREGGLAGQSPLIAELEARVAEMRTIIDTATDGVVLMATDGSIRSISRPAEALFGFDSDEVAGKPFAALFAIESQRAANDYLNGLSDNGVASVLNDGREVIGREAQGRFIPLFMTIGKLPNDSGYCAVVRDITQWKRAEEDLTQARALAERSSSAKTEFLARVSHEIRTPLNAIIGFSELMMDEKFGPVANDRYRDYLRDINRSGNHVLDLVNDLLDISKIEAGQQEMAYEAVSLNDALAESVAMMQPQANRERVIIRSSFASKLPDVVADLRSVRQIALNILSNAVRYTQAGGQVIVSTAYEPSGDVVMRVRDTGIGMTQAEIEQALKPFKQINSLRRARGDGTGLGLPLTKAMVEANRARFAIHSTPGEGTLVEISFPSTRVLAD